jgi:hypothetical protein
MHMASTQQMQAVLSWVRPAAVARGCLMVTNESREVLANHRQAFGDLSLGQAAPGLVRSDDQRRQWLGEGSTADPLPGEKG